MEALRIYVCDTIRLGTPKKCGTEAYVAFQLPRQQGVSPCVVTVWTPTLARAPSLNIISINPCMAAF